MRARFVREHCTTLDKGNIRSVDANWGDLRMTPKGSTEITYAWQGQLLSVNKSLYVNYKVQIKRKGNRTNSSHVWFIRVYL